MIEKIPYRIPIKKQTLGKVNISSTSNAGYEYFREPSKKELLDKINEIIAYLNGHRS